MITPDKKINCPVDKLIYFLNSNADGLQRSMRKTDGLYIYLITLDVN